MTESLFPDLIPAMTVDPYAGMSADAKRTAKQREAVAAGIHPLTKTKARPDLGTCGTCRFRSTEFSYPKCVLGAVLEHPRKAGPYMTRGPATDCRKWWPACDNYEAKP